MNRELKRRYLRSLTAWPRYVRVRKIALLVRLGYVRSFRFACINGHRFRVQKMLYL